VPVEERRPDFVPAGSVCDRVTEHCENDKRRQERDRDAAAAVTRAEDPRAAL